MKIEVRSPYDQSLIKTLDLLPNSAVEDLFENASQASKRVLSKSKRISILNTVANKIEEDCEEIAQTIALEGGKPLTDARVETQRAAQGVRNAIEVLNTQHGTEIPMGQTVSSENRLAFTTREPIGTVVAVSAFNHPFNLIVHQVIPAVAVGCPVIVKPASATPLSCLKLVSMLHEAGLPEEYCQVALLDREGSEALVTDSRVRFFTFIGSAKVGWSLRSKLAPGARCALEHGGVAPVIVGPDADIDSIIEPLIKGGYYHAGQVCVSVQRIYVHNQTRDRFAEAFTASVKKLRVGDPSLAETEVGPLITTKENDRVAQWVEEAVDSGAELLCGGKKISESLFEPTVILEPSNDAKVSTQEVFGPVTCVYGYDDVDIAIDSANSLPVAFQASVFTKNIDFAMRAARGLDAATVMINDHTAFRVDWMPFAGRRSSGLGTGGIPHTMAEMTEEKMIVLKSENL